MEGKHTFIPHDTLLMLPYRKEFQLSQKTLESIKAVKFNVWMEKGRRGATDDSFTAVYYDITGQFFGSAGMDVEEREGMPVIAKILPKRSAFRAGLQVGDVILRFNGQRRQAEEIRTLLAATNFGDPITIATARDGEEKVFRLFAE